VRTDHEGEALPALLAPLSVTWLGHSTVLVEADGTRLLTDPLLRPRVGHVRRVAAAPQPIAGELDAVLLSHVHHDHLDVGSLRRVSARRLIVPRGAKQLLRRRGFQNVVELAAGEEVSIGSVTVRATHAEHEARRLPFGAEIPALGYLVEESRRLYFAGDTDLFDGMRTLDSAIDVALLPVAGWGPHVGPGHLDPQRAAQALQLLRPRVAVPIHWGTYRRLGMSREPAVLREPAERFARLAAELAPEVEVRILEPGTRLELPAQALSEGARQ
jgi:L-ascorbate metabolism protein UlaG (beta-lactamase superfamily)